MLPQLPFDLPIAGPIAVPSLPNLSAIPSALSGGSPWSWALLGATVAVLSLWAWRRARRAVLAATVGVLGLVVAWNAGLIPLVS